MSVAEARRIRRVLVALDASPDSVAAAAAAARLAAALDAELAGLFVEDHDLLRLGRSRLARQVVSLTAGAEPLGAEGMERQLRAQATRARQALSRLAAREGLSYTFQVTRGRVAAEILAAAGREDLVSIGWRGWSPGRLWRLGSTARALLARRRSHTLLAQRQAAPAVPLAVLCDGSEAAGDALRLAARLARSAAGRITVLATSPEAARQATDLEGGPGDRAAVRRLQGPLANALAVALGELRPGLLILPLGGPELGEEELPELLAGLRCPVLAVS